MLERGRLALKGRKKIARDSSLSNGYETRDLHPATLAWCAVGVLVSFAVIFTGIWFFMGALQHSSPKSAIASRITVPALLPPPPRLQIDDAADLQQMRAADDAELHSYGWINRDAGLIRIPIERAIDLTAIRGLPARNQTTQPIKPEGTP